MAKPGRNTIILGGLAVVAVLGWLAWDRLQPGLPAGFASANGRIEATEVDIAALTGGRIAEIPAAEGDMVSAGDVLVQMDVVQLNAQKRQAEAQLARAEIGVETARALVAQAEAQERAAAGWHPRILTRHEQLQRGVRTQQQRAGAGGRCKCGRRGGKGVD